MLHRIRLEETQKKSTPLEEIGTLPERVAVGPSSGEREAMKNELLERGFYPDLGLWSYHVFTLEVIQ